MKEDDEFSEQAGKEPFNPDRAAEVRGKVDQYFQKAQRKIDHITYVNLFAAILAAWIAGYFFMAEAQTTRGIVGCGLIILVALEHTILIKLWYWIANNKISTLYELRLLRLDLTQPQKAQPDSNYGSYQLKQRVSWPWLIAILMIGMIGGPIIAHNAQFKGTMTSYRTVKLNPDGTGTMDTLYSLENTTKTVFQEYSIYSGGEIAQVKSLSPEESPLTDEQGNGIPATVFPAGQNHRFDFHLNKPVMPRERFAVRWKGEAKAEAKEGIWEFKNSQDFSYRHSYYRDSVTLPPGATFVSAEPKPDCVFTQEGTTTLLLSSIKRNGERCAYTIHYTLP